MGVLTIFKNSRLSLNPIYLYSSYSKSLRNPKFSASFPSCFSISSIGYSSFSQLINSMSSKFCFSSIVSCGSSLSATPSCMHHVCFVTYAANFSDRTTNVKQFKFDLSSGDISCVIDIIKCDGSDMESRLGSIGLNLSKWSVIEILRGLNVAKVPALRFFEWVRDAHPRHCVNADICSLMVDNCGRLGDYSTMVDLLKDFQSKRICLTGNAFGFLPILSSTEEVAKKSVRGVIMVLNEVGGSCRNSGVHSMLELLCSMNLFDLGRFVMEITERKASYYAVLVKHKCVKHQLEGARDVIEEMWRCGCVPDAKSYNYLISTVCKLGQVEEALSVLEEMLSRGCPPDVVTFEILIYFVCRCGRSDYASKLYDQMVSSGIKARLPTLNAFIRGYFDSHQFEEAYRYVVGTATGDRWSAQEAYNVLAGLHLKHGDLLVAHNLLVEMIEKGLKPKQSVYLRTSKRLCKTGKGRFAKNLNARFTNLQNFGQNAG